MNQSQNSAIDILNLLNQSSISINEIKSLLNYDFLLNLDYSSKAKILNDFAQSIIHPSVGLKKEYIVDSFDVISDNLLKGFAKGVTIDGVSYRAESIRALSLKKAKIILKEGKKREIRVVYTYNSVKIQSLCRTAIGALQLQGCSLNQGECKELSLQELKKLLYGCESEDSD